MALETNVVDRTNFLYFNNLQSGPTFAPGQTLQSRAGMPVAPGWIYMHGQRRIVGIWVTDQAPAAGFPRFRFASTTGGAGTIVADLVLPLIQDLTQANFTYRFNFAIPAQMGLFEFTNGAVACNAHGQIWMYPEDGGEPDQGVIPPTPAPPAPSTFVFTKDAPLTDMGYQQDTTTTSAAAVPLQGVAAAVAAGALYAQVQSENFNFRWRSDGVAPTALIGNLGLVGVQYFIEDAQLANLQVIGVNAAASVLDIQYWK